MTFSVTCVIPVQAKISYLQYDSIQAFPFVNFGFSYDVMMEIITIIIMDGCWNFLLMDKSMVYFDHTFDPFRFL